MSPISASLQHILSTLPPQVKLIAVSKTHPASMIQEAIDAGQNDFGENRMQEMVAKQRVLPAHIAWHCIGHLQTNKVKDIAGFVTLIHSVDSFHLLREIDRQAALHQRIIPCLLQVHIAQEETKFGFAEKELRVCLSSPEFQSLQHIQINGLMGIASTTTQTKQILKEFRGLRLLQQSLKSEFFNQQDTFKELSMGMSGDYTLAIDEGSTMVRIGSLIFGERDYATV